MKHADMIRDLETLKEFFEEQSGAYPISLEYAIEELSKYRWIPVSERLPERIDFYLISDEKETWLSLWDGKEWASVTNLGLKIDGVLAWMPLPEPYEEEQDE